MSTPFIGEIRVFAGTFAPSSYAFCNGQVLPIGQNSALFSVIGTIYGGDGITTFALPDLRERFPMHWGNGPGLTPRVPGEMGGVAAVTLTGDQLPAHTHALAASPDPASEPAPGPDRALAAAATYGPAQDLLPLADEVMSSVGGGQPHENRQPYLAVHFVIAIQGTIPSRA